VVNEGEVLLEMKDIKDSSDSDDDDDLMK